MTLLDLLTGPSEPAARCARVYGAVVGIVTNNQDPDGLGRVKVRFPWLSPDEESHWARVATFMAGKARGGWFLPEVDDEVIVVFEHGDVRFPFVVGALWNGVDTAPYDNGDGKNDVRAVTSRSGHEVIFDDNDQKGRLEIHTKAGHRILLDDSSGSEKLLVEDKSGNNKIEMDSVQGSIAVTAQTKLSLKASMIEVEADTTLNLKAGATLEIQGALVKIN
jgi:uncharacterized protein involved in type VI secretion and phage assembly